MTTTAAEAVDLDRIERDMQEQVERLRSEQQGLALDALTDPAAARELTKVKADLTAAQQALEHLELARIETGRREQEARDQQAQRARDEALARARELQVEREKAARAFDSAAGKLATALAGLYKICGEQSNALAAAGERQASWSAQFRPGTVTDAVKHALHAAGAPDPFELPPTRSHPLRALAEGDVRPIGPISNTKTGDTNEPQRPENNTRGA